MRLAFVHIAEAYQLYHAAAIIFELMQREDVSVDVFYIDPAVPEHLDRLRQAHGMPEIGATRLKAGPLGKAIQSVKLLGLAKPQVLANNRALLSGYDGLLSTEDAIVNLFDHTVPENRPANVIVCHGTTGRHVPSFADFAKADLIVAKGPADRDRIISFGLAGADQVVSGGYPKLHTTGLVADQSPALFANDNPIVLYNPHKEPKERSWDRFFNPMLEAFREDRSRNLIVAPHIKFFRRRSERVRANLRALSDETILVDPSSPSLLDNTYTEAANIYVGDVSSQVVEFLARPRPCVFLNAHGVDWREDPHYEMWHMGEVVDDPTELMAAIERAPELHSQYESRQMKFASSSLGDTSEHSVLVSADLIHAFMLKWTGK